jgi:hypothetical protein
MPVRAKHWECADGRKFDDRKAATRHERWLELVKLCGMMLEAATDAEGAAPADEPDRFAERLAAEVRDCSTELRRILRANPCEGGGETEGAGGD